MRVADTTIERIKQTQVTFQRLLLGIWQIQLLQELSAALAKEIAETMLYVVLGKQCVNAVLERSPYLYQRGSVPAPLAMVSQFGRWHIASWQKIGPEQMRLL